MRSFAFFFALSLQAQPPRPELLEKVKQFSPPESVSCTQVAPSTNSRTITMEMTDLSTLPHGTPSSLDTRTLLQDVFSPSSGTGFEFDRWASVKGKKTAVYRYSNRIDGKTHAGLVYADENGTISRITFRAADTTAHLFCSAQSR
jgi:hypothetical protein